MFGAEIRASIRELPHRDLHALRAPAAPAQAAGDGFEVVEESERGVVDAFELGLDVVPVEGDDAVPTRAVELGGDVVSEVDVPVERVPGRDRADDFVDGVDGAGVVAEPKLVVVGRVFWKRGRGGASSWVGASSAGLVVDDNDGCLRG